MDAQRPYPHQMPRRGTETCSSSPGGRRGDRGQYHVTGAPEGRGNPDGVPQGLGAANTSPHPPQPAATPTKENDEASRSRRPVGGGASLPLLTTLAIFQSQSSASVEPLHGGHA
ncbi:hypothetical protein E2C01_079354 [Portunus trituberculatus]|uniref:Uncharacterized protein n=1 Tax=Portunus trituberculatus TaxID=210409 RepID=A0A5B7IJC3_PORTR|nr:hypothetical protein [Portunus trituberculatus]